MPTYNVFGWQKPCYLLADGYADTFQELMETTSWESYGTESGNKKCANCMVHSGYEATAVHDTFNSIKGLWATIRATFFNGGYVDPDAQHRLDEEPSHGPMVQLSIHGQSDREPQSSGV